MNDTVTTEKKKFKDRPSWNAYKPLAQDSKGAALQFSYDSYKRAIFLEAAQQKGAKLEIGSKDQFDWGNKIVFKIGVADIGKLLVLFAGRAPQAKCLHTQQSTGRTSVLEIVKKEFKGQDTFGLTLSRTEDGSTQRVNMFLSQEELMLLAHFVRESLTRMFGFNPEPSL